MLITKTLAEAEAAVVAAGYTVSKPRTWYDAGVGFGHVFSYECDHRAMGHALMTVRFLENPAVAAVAA